jgi:predicted Zn-dependent peptidase
MDYRKTTLPNGLRLLTREMSHTRSASIMFFFNVGSRHENETEAGLSHFVEHMCFKGTARRPQAQDISATIEGVGGILNAGTNQESTLYWAKVAQPHFSLALDLLVDMLRHSKVDAKEVEKERSVILEEIHMTYDNPGDLVSLLIDQTLWPGHPLGRDIAGYENTVAGFTHEDLVSFASRHYTPDNCVISVAGNVSHAGVLDEVTRLLGDWQGESTGAYLPVTETQTAPRVKVHYKAVEQANLCLALPGLRQDHPDRFIQGAMNTILGEGMSSRLFLEIREKHALAYDVHSFLNRFRDTGSTVVFAGVDPKRTGQTIQAILDEVERLRQVPVPESEITKAKEFTKGRMLLGLEDSRAVAGWLGGQELSSGRILSVDEVVASIEAVTAADIQRVARDLFTPEKLNLAIVGPFKKETQFAKLLKL